VGVGNVVLLGIPPSSLQINTIDIAAIFRFFLDLCIGHMIHNFALKLDTIDCNYIFTSIVLESASNKSLREEESTDPEYIWSSLINPFLQELDTSSKILSPRTERFHGKESNIGPDYRYLLIEQRVTHLF